MLVRCLSLLIPRRCHPVRTSTGGHQIKYRWVVEVSLKVHTHTHISHIIDPSTLASPRLQAPWQYIPLIIRGFAGTERSPRTQFNPTIPPCPVPHSCSYRKLVEAKSQLYQGLSSCALSLRQTTCLPLRSITMSQHSSQYLQI